MARLRFTIAQHAFGYCSDLLAALAACVCGWGISLWLRRGSGNGRTFTRLPRSSKKLALTYDDGPNDPHTLRLMEELAKHDVRATFFVIGRYAQQKPQIVRDLVKAGHVVGNHTYTHPNLALQNTTQVGVQLRMCQDILSNVIGAPPKLFRPPYGGLRLRRRVLRVGSGWRQ